MAKFHCLIVFTLLLEIWGNLCTVIICFPVCDIINFETNLRFLIKLFFYMIKKEDKNLDILRMKEAFKMKMHFP